MGDLEGRRRLSQRQAKPLRRNEQVIHASDFPPQSSKWSESLVELRNRERIRDQYTRC